MTAREPGPGPTPIRVVVADDQPLERTGNALILDSDDGIEVVGEAGTGAEAVRIVAEARPDVVLMDVRMPVMDGLEATRIITAAHPATRVIVLTTFDLDEYAFGSLRAGASAFLLKSTRPAALVDAVKTVASGDAVAAPRLTARLIEHYLGRAGGGAGGGAKGVGGAAAGGGAKSDAGSSDRDRAGTHRGAAPRNRTSAELADEDGGEGRSGIGAHPEAALDALSPREREIFTAIVRGLSNAEISAELFLAPSTVKSHINSIFAKLALRDRVHAVILGYELGLAGPG